MKLSLERVYAEGLAEAFADQAGLREQLRFGNRAEVPGHCERSAAVQGVCGRLRRWIGLDCHVGFAASQ